MTKLDPKQLPTQLRAQARAQSRGDIDSELTRTLLTQIRLAGLPEPTLEYRFASPRQWRADLAYPDLCILIEVEGGVWSGGRHTRGAGYSADVEKYTEAALRGWCLVRVTGEMIKDGRALAFIERALAQATETEKEGR